MGNIKEQLVKSPAASIRFKLCRLSGSLSYLLFITFSAGRNASALKPAQYKPVNVMPHAMQHIGQNNITFGFRILLPFLLIWFFRDAFQYMLNLPFEKTTIPMIFVIGIIHIWLILFLVIGLFFKVSNVDISDQELITGNLMGHKRVINISDIIGYSTTTYMTISYRGYTGLLLYLNSGKVVELTEYNIKTIKPIYSTFLEGKIKHFGHEMSWFPFRPFKYKFKDIAKHAA